MNAFTFQFQQNTKGVAFYLKVFLPFRFRFRKIRNRFLAALILISLPPLFILGVLSFNIAKNALTETNLQTAKDHLQNSSEKADLLFRNVINLSRFLVLSDDIRDELRDSTSETDQHELMEKRKRLINMLQGMIYNSLIDLRYVVSLCLYDLNFEAYCLGRPDNAGIYEGDNKIELIHTTDWYRETVNARGRVVFFSTNVLGDASKSFSVAKLFRDSESDIGEPLGLIIINVSKTVFDTVFSSSGKYGGEFLAIDHNGHSLVPVYNRSEIDSEQIRMGTLEEVSGQLQSQGYLVAQYKNETTDWMFLHLIKSEKLLQESQRIGTVTALIASAIALFALIVSYAVSGTITQPLQQLKKMMIEWMKGARDFAVTFDQDEVGTIGETFKRVVVENRELNEKLVHAALKEREAELLALQAQIKPHFLYNTLDSIYWMATLHNNREIAQMAVSLSESFKLSLNKGRETIPVYKELKHIQHYMTIQNIRYNHRFQYEEDVDPSLMVIEILRLVLQPLVENAISHGLEPKIGKGTVRLIGRRNGDEVKFVVEDDGVGMENIEVTEQGYGLQNVKERLMLYYGSSCSFTINSAPNQGTRVQICFKLKEREECNHAASGSL